MKGDTTVSVYLSRKVSLGDYEMADVFVKWEGVPLTVGEGFLTEARRTTDIVVDALMEEMNLKVQKIRTTEAQRRKALRAMEEEYPQ